MLSIVLLLLLLLILVVVLCSVHFDRSLIVVVIVIIIDSDEIDILACFISIDRDRIVVIIDDIHAPTPPRFHEPQYQSILQYSHTLTRSLVSIQSNSINQDTRSLSRSINTLVISYNINRTNN